MTVPCQKLRLTPAPDAASHSVSYTYTPGGRLASRTWARGTNATYAYNTAGSVASVVYSDSTPGLTNTYDRFGRKVSVLCGATTTSFAYNLANEVLSESYSGGVLGGLSVTNGYDTLLRRTNLTALHSGVLARTLYGYDNASRLASVTDGTNSAAYAYLANSSLVGQITFAPSSTTRMTTAKQYDYLNRLSSISSTPSNSFAYEYNSANQRTMDRLADGSYWRYGYDSLGQVISGNKYWNDETPVAGQQFDYGFDTIGNRLETEAGGDQNGENLRLASYTNNSLNQITSRSVPAYVDVMGDGIATNPVTVNGTTAYRKNEYFREQVSVVNTSPVWESVTVAAPGQTSVTRHEYVAQTPENYTYDADGNLLSDGRWNYTWDGENRLLSMTSLSGGPSGSQLELHFAYDYRGRRIQKVALTNIGGTYTGEYTNNYVYDRWNCVALLGPTLNLSNSFMWGLDLSGSTRGAGGVGGLLAENIAGSGVQFVAYDGNGNVSALVNAANGVMVANYEYGPFGEVSRATGPMAKLNPVRFSSKFDDDETDFLYYGYRYYNANTGRWLSSDPLENKGGDNLYAFVANSAVNDFDMDGQLQYGHPIDQMLVSGCGNYDFLFPLYLSKDTQHSGVVVQEVWVLELDEGCCEILDNSDDYHFWEFMGDVPAGSTAGYYIANDNSAFWSVGLLGIGQHGSHGYQTVWTSAKFFNWRTVKSDPPSLWGHAVPYSNHSTITRPPYWGPRTGQRRTTCYS